MQRKLLPGLQLVQFPLESCDAFPRVSFTKCCAVAFECLDVPTKSIIQIGQLRKIWGSEFIFGKGTKRQLFSIVCGYYSLANGLREVGIVDRQFAKCQRCGSGKG